MSRRAVKAINWAALAERIPESEKNMLSVFKAKSDQYLRRMTANPETQPKIDWAYYKKNITTPGLVDSFQKQYEAMSVPYPADKYTAQIEAQEKDMTVKMQAYSEELKKEIEKAKEEIARINSLLPFSEMTMEDVRDLYPDKALHLENPSIWPHLPETQPSDNPQPEEEHH